MNTPTRCTTIGLLLGMLTLPPVQHAVSELPIEERGRYDQPKIERVDQVTARTTTATSDSQMHADWNGAEIGIREGTIHRTGIHSNVRTAYSSADLILTGFSG